MASKKTPKADLVAICRLEFYRKQKSWKFCSQERIGKESKKRAKSSKSKLNQTYSIEPKKEPPKPEEPEKDDHPDLDEAFVETESDEPAQSNELVVNFEEAHITETVKLPSLDPPNTPYSPKWSIQRWAEGHRLWSPEPSVAPDSNCPQPYTNPTEDAHYPNTQEYYQSQCTPEKANFPSAYTQEDYSIPVCYDTVPNIKRTSVLYYNQNIHHGYGSDGQHANIYHMACDTDMGHVFNVPQSGIILDDGKDKWEIEELGGCLDSEGFRGWEGFCAGEEAASMPDWAEDLGSGGDLVDGAHGDTADWMRDDLSMVSLPSVSSGEFIRGAALAPHSTQIDLLAAAESSPTSLSGAALSQAVKRHSAALRQLLAEARRRQEAPIPDPRDEVPVRDPGPAPLPLRFADQFVSGSFRNTLDLRGHTEVGRGRGRLKVIGIGMGRPYRL